MYNINCTNAEAHINNTKICVHDLNNIFKKSKEEKPYLNQIIL